jgi:hypothetical protein
MGRKSFKLSARLLHNLFISEQYPLDSSIQTNIINNKIKENKMKKSLIAVLVAVLLVGVVGTAGAVYAQSSTPEGFVPGQGFGRRAQVQIADGTGIYHEELLATFAEKLGLSVDDLEARIVDGETLVTIALAEGMTFEDIKALMPMGNMGRGGRFADANGEFVPGENCDGSCLVDGEYVPQNLGSQWGAGMSRGGRGGGRW